MLDFFVKIPTT